jgi:hypothetical protein
MGVVADVARCQWLHLAKYMMQASVPLWFYWGKSPFYVTPLESWICDEFYLGDGDPITVKPTDVTGRVLPPVIPNSGQRPGETMEQFFFPAAATRREPEAKRKPLASGLPDRLVKKHKRQGPDQVKKELQFSTGMT